MRAAWLLMVAVAAGCSSEDATAPITTTSASASAGVGGSGGTGGAGGGDARIVIEATEGELALDFDVTITGEGSAFIGAIDVSLASGTAAIGGETLPVVAYERQPFGEYLLFQLLAVATDRWYLLWAYCQGEELAWVYFEGTDGTALDLEPASGSCLDGSGPTLAAVSFPAIDMAIPPLIDGFTIDGPDVELDGASPGLVQLGSPHTVLAFEDVDCTTECGQPGWRELHSILWDPAGERACFGIFYLFADEPDVLLTYALTLPDLSDPAGALALPASWTHTP